MLENFFIIFLRFHKICGRKYFFHIFPHRTASQCSPFLPELLCNRLMVEEFPASQPASSILIYSLIFHERPSSSELSIISTCGNVLPPCLEGILNYSTVPNEPESFFYCYRDSGPTSLLCQDIR